MRAIDAERLRELREDLKTDDNYREVLSLAQAGLASKLQAIRSACQSGDTDALLRATHALISTGGTVGATQLTQLCTRIQQEALDGAEMAGSDDLATLEQQIRAVDSDLKEIISRGH